MANNILDIQLLHVKNIINKASVMFIFNDLDSGGRRAQDILLKQSNNTTV